MWAHCAEKGAGGCMQHHCSCPSQIVLWSASILIGCDATRSRTQHPPLSLHHRTFATGCMPQRTASWFNAKPPPYCLCGGEQWTFPVDQTARPIPRAFALWFLVLHSPPSATDSDFPGHQLWSSSFVTPHSPCASPTQVSENDHNTPLLCADKAVLTRGHERR